MFLWMTALTGIIYPLIVTAIAQLTMKHQADGGFVSSNGKLVGAALIAQKFETDKYFWGRPSATDFSAMPSGGSNLGPISEQLKKQVQSRREKLLQTQGARDIKVPSELLFASGSGLDPHITPEAARFQIGRIQKARGLDQAKIAHLIDEMTQGRAFGFLGEQLVNVLLLNMALDELSNAEHPK